MKLLNSEFVTSSDCLKNCPEFNLSEIAIVGRSNVGKSSFINAICNRKQLARTSNTPGKTRLINFYKIGYSMQKDENPKFFIIADLPGYGFAKVSKTEQQKWKKTLEEYLLKRESIKFIIQLIDGRHAVQNNDLQMREWLDYNKFPVITVATKLDTMSRQAGINSVRNIEKTLNTKVIGFSAKTGTGKDEILKLLDQKIAI